MYVVKIPSYLNKTIQKSKKFEYVETFIIVIGIGICLFLLCIARTIYPYNISTVSSSSQSADKVFLYLKKSYFDVGIV
jgi:hypothetical protein